MEQILENLDLSPELKLSIQESFNTAVLEATNTLVETKTAEHKEYLDELIESKLEEYKTLAEAKDVETEARMETYMTAVVNEFVEKNVMAIEEEVQKAKYDAVVEAFEAMLVTTGVSMKKIVEAKVQAEVVQVSEDDKTIMNTLAQEVASLRFTNAELLKTGIIKEAMEDMNLVQKEKFLTLAKTVTYSAKETDAYVANLNVLAESIRGIKETPVASENQDVVVESVQSKKYVSAKASHLY